MPYPNDLATHFLGVGGVVTHQGKVLLVKLSYGRARNRYLIPGGLLERGETLQEGLIREIKEETNMDVQPRGIIGIRSMVRNTDGLTDVYTVFSCDLLSDPQRIKPQDSEIDDVIWMDLERLDYRDDVPEYTRTIVRKALTDRSMLLDGPLNDMAKKRFNLSKYEQFWI